MEKVNRYELRGEIGRGGMAAVYRAFDPQTHREVAVKLLPPQLTHNPEFRKRFTKELKIISSLEHVAIVPVYDSGEDDGRPYFVMRYMKGGSLKDWLKRGPLSLQEAAVVVEKLALGLDYAHKRGIIHCDLKPDNILFDDNGNPCLSDFGIAKLSEAGGVSTSSGTIGTPEYISPEQAQSLSVDHRADIYGLGVMLYEMLTGRKPYQAADAMGVLVKHVSDPVPNILEVNPRLPASLDTIIKTAMAKNREDRYPSVLEFSRALSVATFGEGRTLPAALVLERKQKEGARQRKGWLLGGALSLIVIAFAAGYFSLPYLMPAPTSTLTPTPTSTVSPSLTPTSVPPSATPSVTPTMAVEIAVASPTATPLGGAQEIAMLLGNSIIQRSLDGTRSRTLDSRNFEKVDLQWTADGRLFYIYPQRHCAYFIDTNPKEIICFQENLTAFRVSPDGNWVAISLNNSLYIVPFQYPFREESWLGEKITKDLLLGKSNTICRYTQSVKDVRWSQDGKRMAALVVDSRQNTSEQIRVFNVDPSTCNSGTILSLIAIDRFPANASGLEDFDSRHHNTIPSFDWDGEHQFLLNDSSRNIVFGHLYLYDGNTGQGRKLAPLGPCCYREARWSPDKKYVLFLYQGEFERDVHLYYIPADNLDAPGEWTPVNIDSESFQIRELTYPAIKPIQ